MIYLKTLKAVLALVEKLATSIWARLHTGLDNAKKKLQKSYDYEADRTARNRREELKRYEGVVDKLKKLGNDLDNLI